MNLQQAIDTLDVSIEGDGGRLAYLMNIDGCNTQLTVEIIDQVIAEHNHELEERAHSSMIGGMQYFHKRKISALEIVREAVARSYEDDNESVIGNKHAPSLFENEEYRDLVETMGLHKLYKSAPNVDFNWGYKVLCRSCGEMPIDTDEDLHVAHQVLLAGFRK